MPTRPSNTLRFPLKTRLLSSICSVIGGAVCSLVLSRRPTADAESRFAVVDGSVDTVKMSKLWTLALNPTTAPDFLPCGTWNVSQALLAFYGIDQDGMQNGSPGNGGPYYQFFWATRKGITGHDINK